MLREFLYVDVNRARSFLAQLDEGVVETVVGSSGRKTSWDVSAGVWAIKGARTSETDTSAQESKSEVTAFEVGRRAPTYQALPPPMRDLIETTYVRFADLIDSPLGGPHAGTYVQSAFDRERIAQLLHIAMSKLNIISSPHAVYTIMEPDPTFPLSEWGGLLSQMLYIETIRHLRRIYVEQPETLGVNLARLDRRDYLLRWETLQREAQEELDTYIDSYRMAHMGLGGGVLTVAGGIYGSMSTPTHLGNMGAHRGHWWYRGGY